MVLLIATRLLFALEFLCCTALGQESSELGKLDLSFGYSYVHVSSSSTSDLGTQSLSGAAVSVSYQLTPWLRIVGGFGLASAGYRMSDIIGISLRSAQSTYLFGLCFVPPMGRTTPSAQVLYGVARANAGMFDTSSKQTDFAWAVPTENSVRITPHPCGTLIADLVDAPFLLASTSESKDWLSLLRRVVEYIQVQGVRVMKESGFDQQKFGRVDQGEAALPLRKATVEATGLLRLCGASLISVV